MKAGEDFFKIWGGIAGVQHSLPLLLQEGHERRGLDLPAVSRLLSHNPAVRFRLPPEKGGIKVGGDADLVLVDLSADVEVRKEELLDRHRLSPYVGRRMSARVVRTLLRGQTVFQDGKIISKPAVNLVKPIRDE
jgi:allantoinase